VAVELAQPGVEIIQEFQAATPTVITPTLRPSVVGVAKQVVNLNVSDGAGGTILNPDGLIQLPAQFTATAAAGSPAVYGGLDGLALIVSINNGPNVTITFSDSGSGLTPSTVVTQVLAAFATAGVTAATAVVVDGDKWQMKTIGVGSFQTIKVVSTSAAAVLTAFGVGAGKVYAGQGAYNQLVTNIPQGNFPDPRSNLSDLAIVQDSIRAFLYLGSGSGVREAERDQAFLRNGEVDDAASVTGSVNLTTLTLPGDVEGLTLIVSVDGGATQTVTYASASTPELIRSQTQAAVTGITATIVSNNLVLTSNTTGVGSSVTITGGTAAAVIGLAAASDTGENIAAIDDGDGDSQTSLLDFSLEDFTATATAASVEASAASGNPADGTTLILNDGQQTQTITFVGASNITATIAQINAVMGSAAGGRILASDAGGGELLLTHLLTGTDSVINILGGTALTTLDPGGGSATLVVGTFRGVPNVPLPGDELWIDGISFGEILEVAPGGDASALRINKLVTVSSNVGTTFYIVAKNLPTSGRPTADLTIDASGNVVLKQEQLRDISGNVTATGAVMYISYTAVRKDVTALASNPGLLVFDDTIQLENALAPVDTTNPLALGLFFALLNAPGIQVTGLGVDEVSADAEFGTVDGFARAASYLEGQEVYAVAPLTHEAEVHQIFSSHATVMSAAKGERVAIVNVETPTSKLDTLVASGTGDGVSTTVFDTNISNLTALLLNAGISPIGTIDADEGLFIDIASDAKKYSIQSVSGSQVTIRTSFSTGENDDSFYSTTAMPASLIQEAFSISVRGAPLVVAGIPNLTGIAETIAGIGRGYGSRRLWMTFPDQVAATINGIETVMPGFYASAAIAGMVGQNPPQQGFTRFPMTGFSRVIGSNNKFSNSQLNVMAAGGAWILIQEAQGAPIISRHALTTDTTSIEVRESSITKVVDYTAKFMRKSLLNYIGRFNVTQGFLDTLSKVIQGLGKFLVEQGVLNGFNLNLIQQDTDNPDSILVDCILDVPFPCNYIRLTLVI
jgi:hypothetical protein